MKKMCFNPIFCRLGPAILLISFLITGCSGLSTETRYDDRTRKYNVGQDEQGKAYTSSPSGVKYTLAKNHNATANYILRQGNRSESQTKIVQSGEVIQTETVHQPGKQVTDSPLVLEAADILFEFDKAVIKQTFSPELERWVDFFQNNPQLTAEIYGHADSTGEVKYNQKLSERRAQAVVNYLVEKGIDPKRLTAKGFGESQPAAPNTTGEGRQKNRRVELNY